MLTILAEATKISPSIPLLVAVLSSVVGFGVQYALCWRSNTLVLKLLSLFIYVAIFVCLVEVFINPFTWHGEWHKLSALAAGLLVLVGLSGVMIACLYGLKHPDGCRSN